MEENINEIVPEVAATEEAVTAPVADSSPELNVIKLRAAKQAEKERADGFKAQLEELRAQQAEAAKQEAPEYGDDDFIEGKHLRKELDAMKKQQQEFQAKQRETDESAQLRRKYTDFSAVMTDENAERLKELDPETFMTIANSTASYYQRSAAAYKRIKELGIYVEDKHAADRAKTEANVAKPRPMNSISPQQGDSPLSMANAFANGLTDDVKKQLYKEMQDAVKGH